jgi:hypothetical protein
MGQLAGVAVFWAFMPSGCDSSSPMCNCPATGIWPLVAIEPPCTPPPTLTLTGVCQGTDGTEAGEIVFGANDAGSCHVQLLFANGSTFTTDVEFSGEWLACGSEPHGCGELITPTNLPMASDRLWPKAAIWVGSYCSGDDAAPGDATPE